MPTCPVPATKNKSQSSSFLSQRFCKPECDFENNSRNRSRSNRCLFYFTHYTRIAIAASYCKRSNNGNRNSDCYCCCCRKKLVPKQRVVLKIILTVLLISTVLSTSIFMVTTTTQEKYYKWTDIDTEDYVVSFSYGVKNKNKKAHNKNSSSRVMKLFGSHIRNFEKNVTNTVAGLKNLKDIRRIEKFHSLILTIEKESFAERREKIDEYCYRKILGNSTLSMDNKRINSYQLRRRGFEINRLDSRKNWIFFQTKQITSGENQPPIPVSIEWCPVYKAASSQWMAIFGKLSGFLTNHTETLIRAGKSTFVKLMHDFRLNIPKRRIQGVDRVIYKMIIVRHPFERLVSAYRDKLERVKGREFYHKTYGKRIAARHNNNAKLKYQESVHLLIANILKFRNRNSRLREGDEDKMLDLGLGLESWSSNLYKYKYKPPTFKEFIEYLISIDRTVTTYDEHWKPYWEECHPCQYSFDLILKVETLNEDKEKILRILGYRDVNHSEYKELAEVWKRWTNKAEGINQNIKNPNSDLKMRTAEYYFSQITMNDLKAVYKIYEKDFLLFNYSPDKYFDMVTQTKMQNDSFIKPNPKT